MLGAAPVPTAPPASFWDRHGDAILVAVLTAVLILVLSETIKALFRKAGAAVAHLLQGFGWRFRKRYLTALADRHRWLPLIGVGNRFDVHRPRLQEVFVSLRVAAGRVEDGPRFGWPDAFGPEERRVAILGAPGAGKSTLLDYLVLVLTGEVRHPLRERLDRPLPLIARLRELGGDKGPATLPELLRVAARQVLERGVPAGFPERWLARGGCAVLLDGLDEVLDEERHARVVEEIEKLVRDFPDNRYVVTCRVAGWRNQLPGFRTYEIQELGPDDVRRFLGSWYREVLRKEQVDALGAGPDPAQVAAAERRAYEEASQRADGLWQALQANEGLLRIAGTPLLLSLITLVHYHRVTDLPRGRAALYKQCLEILLDLWDRQDKRLRVEGPSFEEKRAVLQAIAYHFLENDVLEADLAELRQVVEPLLPELERAVPAEGLIRQIYERSGVLVEQALGRYGFAHRALHDYLAAAEIVARGDDRLLVERAGEERWREVILIAAGLAPAPRPQALVEALLAREGEAGEGLAMAGLCLAEGVRLGQDLRAEVRRRLLGRLTREEAAGPFGRLARALLAADLAAARDWMGEVLQGSDPRRSKRVLELLPELGEDLARPLLPLLAGLLADGAMAPAVRTQAARALAGLKCRPDPKTWEALAQARREAATEVKAAATWAWCELGRFEELGLVRVPAGEFLMGSMENDPEADDDEKPQHTVYLPTFYIGRAPVTVAEFRRYVETSGREPGDRDALGGAADHPVVWVSWDEARAYAEWHGFELPGEAEWEKAARGADGRRYPWGDEWVPGRANSRELWRAGRWRLLAGRFSRRRLGTTPVGRYSPAGDSPYGCVDMAGNVWEWSRSLWKVYPYRAEDGRESLEDSQGLRVVRGGSAFYDATVVRCAVRLRFDPAFRSALLGFRVVCRPHSPLDSEPSGL